MIPLAQVFRNNLLESEHYGVIARANASGQIFITENSDFSCFTRSLIKPIQAKVAKDILGDELSDDILAISMASHIAEPEQLNLVHKLMDKFAITEQDLQCGTYRGPNYNFKSKLEHNCSGKHSALIAACKKQEWSSHNYMEINHPLQKAIHKELRDLIHTQKDFKFGVDGCGLPSFYMSLQSMAKLFVAILVKPEYQTIIETMQKYPHIIGGKQQIDSLLMHHNPKLIAKGGAEGLMMIANTEIKEAVVIKIIDGSKRVKTVVSKALCKKLNWLENDFDTDDSIYNSNKDPIGLYAACLQESFSFLTSLT